MLTVDDIIMSLKLERSVGSRDFVAIPPKSRKKHQTRKRKKRQSAKKKRRT